MAAEQGGAWLRSRKVYSLNFGPIRNKWSKQVNAPLGLRTLECVVASRITWMRKGSWLGLKGGPCSKIELCFYQQSRSEMARKWENRTTSWKSGSGATQKAYNLNKFYSVQEVLRLKPPWITMIASCLIVVCVVEIANKEELTNKTDNYRNRFLSDLSHKASLVASFCQVCFWTSSVR